MITVLIVVVYGIGSTAVTSVEFTDPAACARAASSIHDVVKSVVTICTPKRS
jgi:hypothetical protein